MVYTFRQNHQCQLFRNILEKLLGIQGYRKQPDDENLRICKKNKIQNVVHAFRRSHQRAVLYNIF